LKIIHIKNAYLSNSSSSFIFYQNFIVPEITKKFLFLLKNLPKIIMFVSNFTVFFFCLRTRGTSYIKYLCLMAFITSFFLFNATFHMFFSVRVSIINWHCCLSHALYITIRRVLSHDNLLVSCNKRQIMYPGCEMAKSLNINFYSSIHFKTT